MAKTTMQTPNDMTDAQVHRVNCETSSSAARAEELNRLREHIARQMTPEIVASLESDPDLKVIDLRSGRQVTLMPRVNHRNPSGITGVHFCRATQKWAAHIQIDKKQTHLGTFATKFDAIQARLLAEQNLGVNRPAVNTDPSGHASGDYSLD